MEKPSYQPAEFDDVKMVPLASRKNKVDIADLAPAPALGATVAVFLENLPAQLAANDLKSVIAAVVGAHRARRPVIFGMGAHVIKAGLSRIVIDLMERGVISAIAMNGAGIIHDFELALVGGTSEDVGAGLGEGSFGMARETGENLNAAINDGWQGGSARYGLGEAVGRKIVEIEAPHREVSILARAYGLEIPATVHEAIGTDIIHMHPAADGAALGALSFYDFRLLTAVVKDLEGGVYINAGSAVILPEVFLKALTIARNGGAARSFTTVNLDMTQHYRPLQNVVKRPTEEGGRGYTITGHHEIMIPLLAYGIVDALDRETSG